MIAHRWIFAGLLALAVAANWLLLAGPSRVLGVDTGNAGIFLLMSAAWLSLAAVRYLPRDKVENDISPSEWRAWIGCGFTAVILLYSLTHASVFQGPPLWQNPDANRVGRNIAMLIGAWLLLSHVLRARWQGLIEQDERDRAIERRAVEWARMGLVIYIIGVAVTLAFSPLDRLTWAPPAMIAHMLIMGLIVSSLIEYLVTAFAYRRDRT